MPMHRDSRYAINGELIDAGEGVKFLGLQRPRTYTRHPDSKIYRAIEGDTWSSIAYKHGYPQQYWWVIAEYNDILDPFEALNTGVVLQIPPLSLVLDDLNRSTMNGQ